MVGWRLKPRLWVYAPLRPQSPPARAPRTCTARVALNSVCSLQSAQADFVAAGPSGAVL